jgi:apolipoprotein N-acyltransferase
LLLIPALPFGLAAGQWGDVALPVMVGDSPVLAVALLAIPALAALLYLARFGSPPASVSRGGEAAAGPPGRAVALAIIVPALAWTALELARAKLDPGGVWGPLFASTAGGPGSALAGLGGPWLLTFAVVAVNYGLAAAIVLRRALPALATVAATVAVVLVAEAASPAPDAGGPTIAVAAVQPGYDTAEEDRPELRYFHPGTHDLAALDTIDDLAPMTLEAADGGASLVVWPEAALFVDPRREPAVRARLEELARRAGTSIVVPYFNRDERLSAALAVNPRPGRAELTRSQPKQRPMWFLGERASSEPARPLRAGGGRVGTLLGVDAQDLGVAADLAGGGAELLAVSTHDWAQLAPSHRAIARTAAVATGLPVVRADWRYGSAVYAPSGETLADAGDELRRTLVTAEVPLVAQPTPYAGLGDLIGWLAVAGALAALAIPRLPRATRRSPAPAPG